MANKQHAGFGAVSDILAGGDIGIAIWLPAGARQIVTSIYASLNNANNTAGATQGTLTAAEAAGASVLAFYRAAHPNDFKPAAAGTFSYQYGASNPFNFSNAEFLLPVRVGAPVNLRWTPDDSPIQLERGQGGIFVLTPPSQDGGQLGTATPWNQSAAVSLLVGGVNVDGSNAINVSLR